MAARTNCADRLPAVITTTGLYWSMIESGIGLVSASLPTIYSLSRKKSYFTKLNRVFKPRSGSMTSDSQMVLGAEGPAIIDSHALKELTPVYDRAKPQNGQILVKKSFHRTEDLV